MFHPRMAASDDDRAAAEKWFLDRGLPAALTARGRARHLLPRSAPALAAYATVVLALLVVYLVMGTSEVYIDGAPTPAERIVLGVLTLAVPLAVAVGIAVSRIESRRTRSGIALSAIIVAAVAGVVQGGASHLVGMVIAVAVVAAATVTGVGAVLGWAVRLTMTQIAAMGALFVGALPVMLLTVVVFFNTYVWIMAATISQTRIWLALAILLAVTFTFLLSASTSRIRPMVARADVDHGVDHDLSGTPFAATPDPSVHEPLTRAERLNLVVVLATAQIAHLLMVAICTAGIYFILGLVVLSPELLAKWTGNGASDGTVLGMTIPVPQALIHMTLLLCALTFMYVSARSAGDDDYKRNFLSPLIDDLHATVVARNRYRSTTR
jgi:hypothetical protein